MSCLVLSCLILSCLVLSYLILSYLILSYLILSYLILSYLILSYLILSYLILFYLNLSCLVLSCLVLSCLVLSCLVLSCLVLSCLVLSCLTLSNSYAFDSGLMMYFRTPVSRTFQNYGHTWTAFWWWPKDATWPVGPETCWNILTVPVRTPMFIASSGYLPGSWRTTRNSWLSTRRETFCPGSFRPRIQQLMLLGELFTITRKPSQVQYFLIFIIVMII